MTVRDDAMSFPRSTMRPAVEGKARGGMSIPVRWSHAPSSTGLGRSGGNGKSAGFDISLPVDQEGPVEELIAADPRSLGGDTPPNAHAERERVYSEMRQVAVQELVVEDRLRCSRDGLIGHALRFGEFTKPLFASIRLVYRAPRGPLRTHITVAPTAYGGELGDRCALVGERRSLSDQLLVLHRYERRSWRRIRRL